jgi:ABC-2 type transport system permease protein
VVSGSWILTVMVKEIRQVSRDPTSLGTLLLIPLFLLLMFGYAISLDIKHIRLVVLDRDMSRTSREFLDGFLHSEYFRLEGTEADEHAIDEALDRGEAMIALVIPPGFGRGVETGEKVEVQAIVDGSNGTGAATAIGYVQAVCAEFSQAAVLRSLKREGLEGARRTMDFRPRILFNPELVSANFLIPGLIVLILFQTGITSTALSIAREKERGTMEQLTLSPVRPLELVVGKTAPYLIIGLLDAAAILAASRLLFGIAVKGSLLDLGLVTVLFMVGCLGFGVLVSTIARTQAVAFLLSVMLTLLPGFILSGFVFPFRNMPGAIQVVSHLIPARYYLTALRAIMLKGSRMWDFKEQVMALLIYAAAVAALSVLRLRRRP